MLTPFGSELKAELLRPRGSATFLKAELLTVEGTTKSSSLILDAGIPIQGFH